MYSRVRPTGSRHGTPYQPSDTCGPDTPRPSTIRSPYSADSDAAVIAVVVADRAGICKTAEPILMVLVLAASHDITLTASAPYSSGTHTMEYPVRSASRTMR